MDEVIIRAVGATGWIEQWGRWLFLSILLLLCLSLTVSAFIFRTAPLFIIAGLSWVGFGVYELYQASSMGDIEQLFGALGFVIAFVCFAYTPLADWRAKREASKNRPVQ